MVYGTLRMMFRIGCTRYYVTVPSGCQSLSELHQTITPDACIQITIFSPSSILFRDGSVSRGATIDLTMSSLIRSCTEIPSPHWFCRKSLLNLAPKRRVLSKLLWKTLLAQSLS